MALAGGATAAWPLAARAQQAMTPVIGVLVGRSRETIEEIVNPFGEGLRQAGYTLGQDVAVEYRFAVDKYDRPPALAADLVHHQVAVILTSAIASALAAKAATATIPVVFVIGGDPIKLALVASLNRPGANVTGVSFLVNSLGAKRLQLLGELIPKLSSVRFLYDPTNASSDADTRDIEAAAKILGVKILTLKASSEDALETAFATFSKHRIDAAVVAAEAYFLSKRDQVIALAARYAVPSIYHLREMAAAGGLVSYGTDLGDAYRQAGIYCGRILRGERPVDLPVMQSTKFELVINMKTANALGLNIPPSILAIADEVIE